MRKVCWRIALRWWGERPREPLAGRSQSQSLAQWDGFSRVSDRTARGDARPTSAACSGQSGYAAADHSSPFAFHASPPASPRQTINHQLPTIDSSPPAFTLIELLVVIAIIAILAAIAMPVTRQMKPDPIAAATRQVMDDCALA